MGILPMSTTGILPVGLPSHGRAKMALRLMARMAMLRPELPACLIIVVYLPPAGKCDFFQPGVPGRVARQAVAPRVSDGGVRVAGGAIQRVLNAARLQFNLYGVPRFRPIATAPRLDSTRFRISRYEKTVLHLITIL